MNKIDYRAIHPDASEDYKQAYDLIHSLGRGESITASPENVKVFRKYVYDLSARNKMEFSTRKRGETSLYITRLS